MKKAQRQQSRLVRKGTPSIPPDLSVDDPHNWDFGKVPPQERTACCWWEYLRESADVRDALRTLEEPKSFRKDISVLTRSGFLDAFMMGIGILKPWRLLNDNEHKVLVRMRRTKPQSWEEAVQVSDNFDHLHQLFDQARRAQDAFKADWERRHNATFNSPTRNTPPLEWLKRRNSKVTDRGTEILLLKIKWRAYPDKDIKRAFSRWVDKSRPAGFRKPRGRRRREIYAKAALRCLALMRVLRDHSPQEVDNKFHTLWTKKYRRDHKHAVKIFPQLFPMVSDERPLSWRQMAK